MTDNQRQAEAQQELAEIEAARAATKQIGKRLDNLDKLVRQRALGIEADVRTRRKGPR